MVYKVDFPEPETAVEWSPTDDGIVRTEVTYRPTFFVAATEGYSLDRVESAIGKHPEVHAVRREHHRPGWRHDQTEMLAVDVTRLSTIDRLASSIAQLERPGAYRLFNVDLSQQFRYCLETETDPTPSRDPTVLRLRTPPTTFAEGGSLEQVTVTTPTGEEYVVDGDPDAVARGVATHVADVDPDVLSVSTATRLACGPRHRRLAMGHRDG